jgi:hypothetical protein
MNDWMIGAMHVIVAVIIFFCGWAASGSTIGWECRNLRTFYVGEKVYYCEQTEKKQ